MKIPHRFISLLAPVIIILVSACCYYSGIRGEFVYDDIGLVESDPFYQDNSKTLGDCWKRPYWRKEITIGQYRPLTIASFWINTKLTGMYSPAFRIVNLLLHIAVSLLVFKIAMVLRLGKLRAFFAALIFSVHPLLSEAVIPSAGRAELLCAFFILSGLIFYIRYGYPTAYCLKSDHGRPNSLELDPDSTITDRTTKALFPAICFLFACWSKENGVVLVLLCLLYDIIFRDFFLFPDLGKWLFNTGRRFFIPYFLFNCILLIVAYSRITGVGILLPMLQEKIHWIDNPLIVTSFGVRILTALKVQGIVFAKFFWPETLSHDYSYAQIMPVANFADFYLIFGIFMLFILPLILCLLLPERKKIIIFLGTAYIISVLPGGNFITPTGTIFGERLYYTPLVWLCCGSVIVILRIAQKYRPALAVSIALLTAAVLACVGRVWVRAQDWETQMNIAVKGVKTAPKSVKTWNNLAVQLANIDELEKAVEACGIALKINPDNILTLTNRGYYYIALDQYKNAENDFRTLIKLGSRNPDVYNKLGAILATQTKKDEALRMWKHSLTINPAQPEIQKALENLKREKPSPNE